jgi:hypothetical protein
MRPQTKNIFPEFFSLETEAMLNFQIRASTVREDHPAPHSAGIQTTPRPSSACRRNWLNAKINDTSSLNANTP